MNFELLLKQIETVTQNKTYDNVDNEYWRLTKDKTGNAQAVIRFLPNKVEDGIPFVKLYTHSFKNPDTNRWYIENSLTTIGKQDAISISNMELWNTGIEENKDLVRTRKRKLNYISNILVIKDKENPDTEGKVYKFKYGKKIFDKIVAAAKPDSDLGEEAINVFDPLTGTDFALIQTQVSGFPNYDKSKFGPSKPIGDKDKIAEVLSKCYVLEDEVAPNKFKTEEELKNKFDWVNGFDKKKVVESNYDEELDKLAAIANEEPKPKLVESRPAKKSVNVPVKTDDDDDAAFFASLLNE